MVAIYERPRSPIGFWSRRLAIFAASLLIAAILAYYLGSVTVPTLFLLLIVTASIAAMGLLLAVVGLAKLWDDGTVGGRASGAGFVIALIVLVPFAYAGFKAATLPALTDISTDLVVPPQFIQAAENRSVEMNPIVTPTVDELEEQFRSYPGLAGRRYSLPVLNVFPQVEALLEQFGWPLKGVDGGPLDGKATFEAEMVTGILRLVSDVAIRLEQESGATFVDIRAASRWGPHDLGANARAIEKFLERLDEAMLGVPATRSTIPIPVQRQ